MSKAEFFDIFREYASKEFTGIPASDDNIDYAFSEEFENKMSKLFEDLYSNRLKNSASISRRKFIAILIAAIIILFSGVMSVGAIRKPVVDFIFKIYDGFTDILFDGNTVDKIAYRYSLYEIPEGFVETQRLITDGAIYFKYENEQNQKIIEFCQNITENISVSLDNEHGRVVKTQNNGNDINIYVSDYGDYYYAFWNVDYYYMELIYHGTTTIDEIINLINCIH